MHRKMSDHTPPSVLCPPSSGICLPFDVVSALDGICLSLPAGSVFISEDGAIARMESPALSDSASFFAASAWAHQFAHITGFPIGFEKRLLLEPSSGAPLFSRIIPVKSDAGELLFHCLIYDYDGRLHGTGFNLRLTTGNSDGIKFPERNRSLYLPSVSDHCTAISVIELQTIMPTAVNALSEPEKNRFKKFRGRRITSYLGARLACKRLSRKLSGNDLKTPADSITTISDDQIRPKCPLTDGSDAYCCSVSHDSRFAIAVASKNRIGADVEEMSERVLNIQRYFMNEYEMNAVRKFSDNEIEASVKIWSIKEAVSKALNINLTDTWKRVTVTDINRFESGMAVDGMYGKAIHDRADNHIFTVVVFP